MYTGPVQDVQANLGQLTKHLKKYCDLKTVKQMVEENERINKQVVVDLVRIVDLKNDLVAASHNQFVHLRNMVNEVDNLRMKAEEEKRLMGEKHKQGKLTRNSLCTDLAASLCQSSCFICEVSYIFTILLHSLSMTEVGQTLR